MKCLDAQNQNTAIVLDKIWKNSTRSAKTGFYAKTNMGRGKRCINLLKVKQVMKFNILENQGQEKTETNKAIQLYRKKFLSFVKCQTF